MPILAKSKMALLILHNNGMTKACTIHWGSSGGRDQWCHNIATEGNVSCHGCYELPFSCSQKAIDTSCHEIIAQLTNHSLLGTKNRNSLPWKNSSGQFYGLEYSLRTKGHGFWVMPLLFTDATKKPGPGAHSPEKVNITHRRPPSYSLGTKHSEYLCPLILDVSD